MIEVLKNGRVPTYIHKCSYCGCVFKYQYMDTEYLSLGDRQVWCPECRRKNKVDYVEYSANHEYLTTED